MLSFESDRKKLLSAVETCLSVAAKSSTMDAITKMKLDFAKDKITASSTDLETSFQTLVPSEGSGAKTVVTPPKPVLDFLKASKGQTVTIKLTDTTLEFIDGVFKSQFLTSSADNFPRFPDFSAHGYSEVPADLFRDAIAKTAYSVSGGDEAYNLKGICLEREGEEGETQLWVVSTDAQRLNAVNVKLDRLDAFQAGERYLCPRKGLQELAKLQPADNVFALCPADNQLLAAVEGESFFALRLLSGHFPNYRDIIPSDATEEIWLDRKSLLAALKRVNIVADDHVHLARFSFSGSVCSLSIFNPSLGRIEDSVDLDYDGPGLEATFNPAFLLETLSTMSSDRVRLGHKPDHPSYLVTAPSEPHYRGVIVSCEIDGPGKTSRDVPEGAQA
jgi:DNA polymerase-3 subunit beta